MGFESVRGYIELASGLGDLTKARARDAAQGLLSLPVAGITTGSKVALQASALADELLAAATANRSNLTKLVRSEVDVAITRLGLVSVQTLEEVQAEAASLRAEVARLRSAATSKAVAPKTAVAKAAAPRGTTKKAAAPRGTTKKTAAPRSTIKRAAAPRSTVTKAASKSATTARRASSSRSAVSTRAKPAGT